MRSAAVLILPLILSGAVYAESSQPVAMFDGLVCRVNMEPISKRDVEGRMGEIGMRLIEGRARLTALGHWNEETEKQWNTEYIPEFRKVLRQIVRERLMLQTAKNDKLELDEKEVRKRVDKLRDRLIKQNPQLVNQFLPGEIYTRVREDMLMEKFRSKFADSLPARKQVEQYYKENIAKYQLAAGVNVRLIRIDRYETNALTGKTKVRENALELAEELRKDVAEYGGNFEQVARTRSDDLESRARGGILMIGNKEYFDPDSYNPQLAGAIRGLQVGQISKVFELNKQSYGIVQIVARREAGPAPLDGEVFDEIYSTLIESKARQNEDEWFRKALKKNLIEIVREGVSQPLGSDFFFADNKPADDAQMHERN